MFTEALWSHIHGTPLPRSDAANVNPPSLIGGFPRAGGGSPADSQPPPPSLPPPYDNANVNPPSIAGALPGAAGVSPAESNLLHCCCLRSLRLRLPFLLVSLTPTSTLTPKLTQTRLRTVSMVTSLGSPGRCFACLPALERHVRMPCQPQPYAPVVQAE
jgi:hypothetical protein